MHKRDLSLGTQTLSIETGRLAKQADGAVIVRLGDTMVLVTACHASSIREGIDFLPLTVDYRENTYASGRIEARNSAANSRHSPNRKPRRTEIIPSAHSRLEQPHTSVPSHTRP